MAYGKGLRRSALHKTAHRVAAVQHSGILAALAAGVRGSADLGQYRPPRMDQGGSSTCFAHSASAVIYTALGAAGKPLAWVPSQVEIASCTYARERSSKTPAGQPLTPLQDVGAELSDVAAVLGEYGILPMLPAVEGRFSDVPSTNGSAFPEADVAELEQAAKTIVQGEYIIDPQDPMAPQTVAASLDAGVPVWCGFTVDRALENALPGDVVGPPDDNAALGGHAVYLAAYRTNAQGKLEFRLENSWGSGWADNGSCWTSEAWLAATWELWPYAIAGLT